MTLDLWQAAIAFAFVSFLLLAGRWTSPRLRLCLLPALLLIALIPVNGLPLCAYLRGFTDDFAMTTMLWMGIAVVGRLGATRPLSPTHRGQLVALFAVLGLLLYPMTLGLTDWDPYRLGYMPRALLAGVGIAALLFWWAGNIAGAALLTVATALFLVDVKNSDNYWDYLVDPFLILYCWGAGAIYLTRRAIAASRAAMPFTRRPDTVSTREIAIEGES